MSAHLFFSLFTDPADWQVVASGQAAGILASISGPQGEPGLRLEYDFHGGGGFVVLRRSLRFTMPETFEIGFHLRGEGLPNHFEFKVADPGGANVWRYLRPDFAMPDAWTNLRIHERDLPFAWGPAGGGAASEIGAVEIVIAAGPGGKGVLEIAGPTLEDQSLVSPREIMASSTRPGTSPDAVFLSDDPSVWSADSGDNAPWWAVDFGRALRFGGLLVRWPDGLPPRKFEVEISDGGEKWTRIYQAAAALGAMSHIAMPGTETRHLRIKFGNSACASLASIKLKPDAFSSTPNEFIHNVAADYPRGWFPRYWLREQSYWTPVGSPEGKRRALINEEGMVEVDEAGFSLEPFIFSGGKRITWADVETTGSLAGGGVPVPSVRWEAEGMNLEMHPWVGGEGDDLTLHVTYRLECQHPDTRLMVAVRPYQVNPPWQAFRDLGGRSPIHRISCEPDGMTVEGRKITVTPEADDSGATSFEDGGEMMILDSGVMPSGKQAISDSGLASAAMAWKLPSGRSVIEVTVSVPYFAKVHAPGKAGRDAALARWKEALGAVQWNVPACAASVFDCFRTAAGHILINRDGPAIQPGPRRYTRSWVRDCVLMGAALAKAGLPDALREFIVWYAQFQRDDGFIPCVVDRDGIDWLVEHDSHGQFLWGVREVFRDGGDRKLLDEMMPHVRKAADFMITLRAQRMTPEYQSGEHAACFGLFPESASHEGYLAHPVHSYWDDFWGVRGFEAAAELAEVMGLTDDAARWKSEGVRFEGDLLRSIERVIADKQLGYIPGSVEWADFDPTATSNAISQLDFAGVLPQGPLEQMLDTYLDGFRRKHRGEIPWINYTAYEIRIIGAFARLGKREEANELLEFFLSDRRPIEWNQWPEITWRDPRSPGHLGDVPHTWIAAEYLLALASMVASEREATDSMVLASGMPWAWISEEHGFSLKGLPTRYGSLDFRIKANGGESIELEVGGSISLPPGGLTIAPPLPSEMQIAGGGDVIPVASLPFRAAFQLVPAPGIV